MGCQSAAEYICICKQRLAHQETNPHFPQVSRPPTADIITCVNCEPAMTVAFHFIIFAFRHSGSLRQSSAPGGKTNLCIRRPFYSLNYSTSGREGRTDGGRGATSRSISACLCGDSERGKKNPTSYNGMDLFL